MNVSGRHGGLGRHLNLGGAFFDRINEDFTFHLKTPHLFMKIMPFSPEKLKMVNGGFV